MSGDILAAAPAAIACLLQIGQAFHDKERDFKQDADKLETANKQAEATTLENLLESQLATSSYEAGDDDHGLRDPYLEYIYKIHKHARLDVELSACRKLYTKASLVSMITAYVAFFAAIVFVITLLICKTLPLYVVIPVGVLNTIFFLIIAGCTLILRGCSNKLDTIKQRGDLIV